MKRFNAKSMLLTFSLIAVLAIVNSSVFAVGSVKLATGKKDGQLKVSLDNFQAENVSLSIENVSETEVFYTENLINGKKQVFDASALADGTYVIIAKQGDAEVRKEFTVKNASIQLQLEHDNSFSCAPVFQSNNSEVLLYYQCPSNEDIKVKFITDDAVAFFFDQPKSGKVARKYNLEQLPEGSYAVEVIAGEQTFSYNFEIE